MDLGSIQDILGELTEEALALDDEDDNVGGIGENDSTIVRLANQIIVDAYKRGASDIHVEPYAARTDTVIRMRIDGSCVEYQRIPGQLPARPGVAPQNHGPPRHCRAPQTARWQDQISPAAGARNRAAGGDDSDGARR